MEKREKWNVTVLELLVLDLFLASAEEFLIDDGSDNFFLEADKSILGFEDDDGLSAILGLVFMDFVSVAMVLFV